MADAGGMDGFNGLLPASILRNSERGTWVPRGYASIRDTPCGLFHWSGVGAQKLCLASGRCSSSPPAAGDSKCWMSEHLKTRISIRRIPRVS